MLAIINRKTDHILAVPIGLSRVQVMPARPSPILQQQRSSDSNSSNNNTKTPTPSSTPTQSTTGHGHLVKGKRAQINVFMEHNYA